MLPGESARLDLQGRNVRRLNGRMPAAAAGNANSNRLTVLQTSQFVGQSRLDFGGRHRSGTADARAITEQDAGRSAGTGEYHH